MAHSLKPPTSNSTYLPPRPEPIIRVRRILEYVGPASWVHETLSRSLVKPNRVFSTARKGMITEVGRIEYKLGVRDRQLSLLAEGTPTIRTYPESRLNSTPLDLPPLRESEEEEGTPNVGC